MSVKQGEFVVIFGLSGGGKTTLLNIIGTIDKPTKGELFLCGHSMYLRFFQECHRNLKRNARQM